MKDLTHIEARDAFLALAKDFGPKCAISSSLNIGSFSAENTLYALLRPSGFGSDTETFFVHADTWRELLDLTAAKLAEHADLHAANTIRSMALKIIEITADQGECTDAALRAEFDAGDIRRHGEAACAAATEMANNGPFSIVKLSGANDRAAA